MAAEKYHGDDADITISTSSGTSITVGIIQGVTVTPVFETDELYGADSILREDIVQRDFEVEVECEFTEWDIALIKEFLGGSGSSSTGVVDTTDPALFTVTGKMTPRDSSTTDDVTVDEVVFDELPIFSSSKDEHMDKNITGIGRTLTTAF